MVSHREKGVHVDECQDYKGARGGGLDNLVPEMVWTCFLALVRGQTGHSGLEMTEHLDL
jgi:hypothetical protein